MLFQVFLHVFLITSLQKYHQYGQDSKMGAITYYFHKSVANHDLLRLNKLPSTIGVLPSEWTIMNLGFQQRCLERVSRHSRNAGLLHQALLVHDNNPNLFQHVAYSGSKTMSKLWLLIMLQLGAVYYF